MTFQETWSNVKKNVVLSIDLLVVLKKKVKVKMKSKLHYGVPWRADIDFKLECFWVRVIAFTLNYHKLLQRYFIHSIMTLL